ncbi:hypothetical protein [Streptomyces tremellae]|uniref:Uncharacterized protein n=1 Tax=Streptomyces tremellae TaxID=1124239 RepID=A0ABP7FT04_9ACTN
MNPWGTERVRVRRLSDNAVVRTTGAAEFTLDTTANTGYVVERTAKPLSGYGHTALTGTANQGVKPLGTHAALGIGTAPNAAAAARPTARQRGPTGPAPPRATPSSSPAPAWTGGTPART